MILNAGNNFDTKSDNNRIASRYILSALEAMGTDAIGVGPEEIRFGIDELKQIAARSSTPVVSANISGLDTHALLLKDRGRLKVLITSVLDPELLANKGINPQGITDPSAALYNLSKNIHHDLFIVIVHADSQKIPSIIQKCQDIDLLIDGESATVSHQKMMNHPPVVSNNRKGEFVSYLDFHKNDAGEFYTNLPVNLRAEVGRVGEDPAIRSMIKDYDRDVRDYYRQSSANKDSAVTADTNKAEYAGSQSCKQCHFGIEKMWGDTKHARAMESLRKKSKEFDPACVSCHTTGNGFQNVADGSFKMEKKRLLTGVECEACHGPGKQHTLMPADSKLAKITKETCKQCHTSEKDPDFDVANYKWQTQRDGCAVASD